MSGSKNTLLVTGGAGFIGSAFVRRATQNHQVVILDSMTYAGDRARLEGANEGRVTFYEGDICDETLVAQLLREHAPQALIHFAAESHVDRSIDGPLAFLKTNVEGTMTLLKATTAYWQELDGEEKERFRFLHVSTDEVYGSLGFEDEPFTERSPYQPNSPYAASKASSDHFVRAWHQTFKLPTLMTHCSNNYGPWQFPEKLIPLMIMKCLKGEPLPVYGDGSNIRDWIHVDDHVDAIIRVLSEAQPGTVWSVGGEAERSNLELVKLICEALNQLKPRGDGRPYQEQITFVTDRPGHDVRYAIDMEKIKGQLGWSPSVTFEEGIRQTIEWYLGAQEWMKQVSGRGEYKQERLGLQ